MSSSPPDGLAVRPATVDDAPAINDLVTAADVAVQGWSESSESELLGWWRMMDLGHNSWVLDDNGWIAAYGAGFVHGETFELDGYVHPERQGRGVGAWLVTQAEARARELSLPRLYTFSLADDDRELEGNADLLHRGLDEITVGVRQDGELPAPGARRLERRADLRERRPRRQGACERVCVVDSEPTRELSDLTGLPEVLDELVAA